MILNLLFINKYFASSAFTKKVLISWRVKTFNLVDSYPTEFRFKKDMTLVNLFISIFSLTDKTAFIIEYFDLRVDGFTS